MDIYIKCKLKEEQKTNNNKRKNWYICKSCNLNGFNLNDEKSIVYNFLFKQLF